MDKNMLNNLISQFNDLKDQVNTINQSVAALKIDAQYWVKSDASLNPGVGCKVAYNKDGLIIKSSKLSASDIPEINIDQVNNLRQELDSKATCNDIKSYKLNPDDIFKHTEVTGTACKVNYDKHGLIINGTELTPEDIPQLSINHINGLSDIINALKHKPSLCTVSEHTSVIKPSTGCKISFDQFGHVTGSEKLSLSDIPKELIVHINEIESSLTNMASQKTLSNLNSVVSKKLDANPEITPGIYTKVMVDSKGLVISGKELEVDDLPRLTILDIDGLQLALNNKVGMDKIKKLNDDLTLYMNSINISNINKSIADAVKGCVSKSELTDIIADINSVKINVDNITKHLPSEMISQEINKLHNIVTELSGRISSLENKYNTILNDLYPLISK